LFPKVHYGWTHSARFACDGALDDQLLCSEIDFSTPPEEVDVGDAQPAQSSFGHSGFIERLSVGELLGGLRGCWFAEEIFSASRARFVTTVGAARPAVL
jgi:hypothetical protein